jgi:tetratricopeptide (TPR) repeat protein
VPKGQGRKRPTGEVKQNVEAGSPTEFDKLLRFIITFQGRFALAFICGDDRRQRQDVLASLGNLLRKQGIELRRIDLTHRAVTDLLSTFKQECRQGRPVVIVVTGIEASSKGSLFTLLNIQRDLISREINGPLLFWVSNFALREIAREAPDLYDFRYTVFDFKSPKDSEPLMRAPDMIRSYFALSDHAQSSAEWTAYLGEQLDHYQRNESSLGYREKLAYGELPEEIARRYRDKQCRTEALIYLEKALKIYGELQEQSRAAAALKAIADTHYFAGDQAQAAESLEKALSLFREIGDRRGEAMALESLGDVKLARDAPEEAIRLMTTAADIYSSINDTYNQKLTLLRLVEIYLSLGELERARSAARQAKDLPVPIPRKLQRWEGILQDLCDRVTKLPRSTHGASRSG